MDARAKALELARTLVGLLDGVETPPRLRSSYLPEQLSFLHMRENYRVALGLLDSGDDISASLLVRAIFEEQLRWAWVDENRDARRPCFVGEAQNAYRLIREAADHQGIDGSAYFGPLIDLILDHEPVSSRFPKIEAMLGDWAHADIKEMLYLQYRVLSQFTHSSLLVAINALPASWGSSEHTRGLPAHMALTLIRNAAGSAAMILNDCRAGLEPPPGLSEPVGVSAMAIAVKINDILLAV